MKKTIVKVIVALVAALLIAYFGISGYIAFSLTQVARVPIDDTPSSLGLSYEDVSFPSREDRLTLKGWYIPGGQDKRAIIMVHGIERHRADPSIGMLNLAGDLVKQGFSVLMFDLRGHGESEGNRSSAGYYERRDLLGAFDYVRSRGLSADSIGIIGFSMGAATAILVAAEEPGIPAIVSDSSFADLAEIVQGEASERWRLPGFFTSGYPFVLKRLYGIDLNALRPIDVVGRISPRPIFFIHGGADEVIPLAHANWLYEASGNPSNLLWVVPGAEHVRSYKTAHKQYVHKVATFFRKALR
jgi:fermentation-respiration switch protein FrsA (DUF1100 family)